MIDCPKCGALVLCAILQNIYILPATYSSIQTHPNIGWASTDKLDGMPIPTRPRKAQNRNNVIKGPMGPPRKSLNVEEKWPLGAMHCTGEEPHEGGSASVPLLVSLCYVQNVERRPGMLGIRPSRGEGPGIMNVQNVELGSGSSFSRTTKEGK